MRWFHTPNKKAAYVQLGSLGPLKQKKYAICGLLLPAHLEKWTPNELFGAAYPSVARFISAVFCGRYSTN